MPAFLCSVPLPVSRPLFLFCRMLSGLFVCLFPGIGCRLFFVQFPAVFRGFSLFSFPRYSAAFLCSVPRGIPRVSFFYSPASDAGLFVCLFPGIECRLFFVLCPSLYLGPCFYSAGCYPAFSYVYSPASDAGVLPPLWRGKVFPFTVQSRDHLATITDIYVPSFPYVHSPAFNAGFLRRSFRRLMSSGFLG